MPASLSSTHLEISRTGRLQEGRILPGEPKKSAKQAFEALTEARCVSQMEQESAWKACSSGQGEGKGQILRFVFYTRLEPILGDPFVCMP